MLAQTIKPFLCEQRNSADYDIMDEFCSVFKMSEGVEVVFLEASRIPHFTKISLLNWRLSRNLSGIDISPSNNEA